MKRNLVRGAARALAVTAFFASACGGKVVAGDENAAGAVGTGGTPAAGGSGSSGGMPGTGAMGGSGGMSGTGATGGSPGTGGACIDCAKPPPADPTAPSGEGPGATFAMSHVYLGDTEPNGTSSAVAWKQYGFDIDGQVSDESSTYHCRVQEGATKSDVQTDGEGGIDNSFGANLMPVFRGLDVHISKHFNESIVYGDYSYLIRIGGLGGGSSYAGLPASVFVADHLGHAPNWDGNDAWPIFCEYMNTCLSSGTPQVSDGNDSVTAYPNSYVVNGVWVSNTTAPFQLGLLFTVSIWHLMINLTRTTLNLNDPTSSAAGMVSGVIDTEEAISSLAREGGQISSSLCSGPTFDAVAQQVRAASDIMKDGTQDPTQYCDGISVGFGFDARPARLGTVLDKQPDPSDQCAGL